MTLHAIDLGLIVLIAAAGWAACYLLLVRKLQQTLLERDLKIADHIGSLEAAVQALETRLAEQRAAGAALEAASSATSEQEEAKPAGESIAGEIKAVIAAAAAAVFGKKAAVTSIRSMPTPWSQQGRVLVQGSHNLRVRR